MDDVKSALFPVASRERMHRESTRTLIMLPKYFAGFLIALMALTSVAQQSPEALLAQYPAQSSAEADALAEAWLAMDDAALAGLLDQLVPAGEGDDVAARFAVSGLAKYVTASGQDGARPRIEAVVAKALAASPPEEVAAFLVRQLALAGTDASVPVLSTLLQGTLCGPAAQALASIGTPAAKEALHLVQAKAADACLLAIEQALETIEPAPMAVGEVPLEPVHARIGAIAVLMEAGESAKVEEALGAAILSDSFVVRRDALRLALRGGGRDQVVWLLDLLDGASSEAQADILAALAQTGDRAVRSAVLQAMESGEVMVRLAAIEALPAFGGGRATDVLMSRFHDAESPEEIAALKQAFLRMHADSVAPGLAELLPAVSPEKQVAALEVLANKQARAQVGAVLGLASVEHVDVRMAAQDALSEVAGVEFVPDMLSLLLVEPDNKGRRHLQDAIVAAVADIEADQDRALPVVEKMANTAGEQRALLLEMLPRIGGRPAYEQVMVDISSGDATVRVAAIDALASWTKTTALSDILALAKTVQEDDERETLLRGYLRIVREANRSDGKKVQFLADALAAATTTGQKRLFIADLGNLRTVGSLQMLISLLEESALQRQAVSAALTVALPGDNYPGLEAAYVASALSKLLPLVDDEATRERIQKHMERMPQPDEEGFIELFNGKDLTGWSGDTSGYLAENGELVCSARSHGNLYSDLAFSDFIFRFEFKLTEGANNGLGIRTPLYGHAAYDGMELQILDDAGHADLKPYQYHGSIYGVAPAKMGFLKPAGEWNVQEVRAVGRQITIVLNGETILDENLDAWVDTPTPDDKEHPGLLNTAGHIAFLGHGSEVAFRHIRIKEVE
jgi:hypothetical protein